jgi:hypothetical protein
MALAAPTPSTVLEGEVVVERCLAPDNAREQGSEGDVRELARGIEIAAVERATVLGVVASTTIRSRGGDEHVNVEAGSPPTTGTLEGIPSPRLEAPDTAPGSVVAAMSTPALPSRSVNVSARDSLQASHMHVS